MNHLKVTALWAVGKLLAVFIFVATSLVSCSAVYYGWSAVFYPEQTDFPNGVPPADFLVVYERREAPNRDETFSTVRWKNIGANLKKTPELFRLSVKEYSSQSGDPWGFKVIEQTSRYQIIALRHSNTQNIRTKYRIEGSRITPLSYKTDGGVALVLLIPVFLGCLWLGWVAARRSTRWVSPVIQALRGGGNGHQS